MPLEGKTDEEIRALDEQLLTRVRDNGGKASNPKLMQQLGWPADDYWPIRNRLIDAGHLALGKGRGGSVRIIDQPAVAQGPPAEDNGEAGTSTPAPPRPLRITEDDLYEPMARVLRTDWARDNRYRDFVVEITARQGRRDTGGRWTRPDLTIVSSTTLMFYPTKIFDVTTFEVKPTDMFDVTAVYEALSHRRAATRSYVLVHIPQEQQQQGTVQAAVEQVSAEAKRHGIGLIVAADAGTYGDWDVEVEAARHEPDPVLLNDFLSAQLSRGVKDEIVAWFR